MPITSYIGSIASSVIKKKKSGGSSKKSVSSHPIHKCTKEQHLKWLEEGKCQCCGDNEGEYKGICDYCRLS